MRKRRTRCTEFNARDAMEAISGRKTLQEIAAGHVERLIQVGQWKKQLLECGSELPRRGNSRMPLRQLCNGLGRTSIGG
ncbi:hypothetical protein VB738_12630 [Cyanobium gracile UHCC 0139]|uniref:Transposase n=1 Tax=Cyanobium gracile UHCC 0139 TaxID=3110308 RepID=A0ABU5RWF0_9CYAN|nr:hypothetical protein [Cyanobium gracile]MEA5392104.1 hypothetical protein [Cyanobium gracile UHCC 0139]